MGFPRENLYRACLPGAEVRAAEGGGMPTLFGHFSVFDTPATISSAREGTFIERVAPGAFKKSMAENRDQIKVMFNHGRDPQIGEKPLGKLVDLREDDIGGYYEVEMSDTSYNKDLTPLLRDGLLGASFRFSVMREAVVNSPKRSAANPEGIPERTIQEARLYELGPVVAGAYKEATAGVRSITDTIYDVDALAYAGAIIMDDERMSQSRIFVSRGLEPGEELPAEVEEIAVAVASAPRIPYVDLRSQFVVARDSLRAVTDDAEPATTLDGDTVEALGSLIEVCESALEAMESLIGIDDDMMPDEDDQMNSAELAGETRASDAAEEEQDAPPDDSAEPSLAHPIRGRRDTPKKSYLRKETPKWQL